MNKKKQIFFKLIANYIRMEKTTTIKLLKSKQKIAYTYDNPLIASNPSTQLQRNIDNLIPYSVKLNNT
ncbi:hypothetical protein DERP_001225 [Dermatophagoides pteronyssinus]|uniref:Uncharacterized protein n=1 Tax=Dermatophagoides pteronyssinus TaxID=6956 RepID=A0ABQ8JDW3_DERPT|nr:hypothetical protein DERP_001225 [Dermatophagoides pteronyssinus]